MDRQTASESRVQQLGVHTHLAWQYLLPGMPAQGSEPTGQQHAVAHAGQVEDSLGHHKAHTEEEVACWQEGDNEEAQAQREGPRKSKEQM